MGVDVSAVACRVANKNGVNAVVADACRIHEFGRRFGAYLILDALEHIEDRDALARAIRSTRFRESRLFLNLPMYRSEHAEPFEWNVGEKEADEFMGKCGWDNAEVEDYQAGGWPYRFIVANTKEAA